MKKLFFSAVLLFAITATVNAQVTRDPNPMATTPATQPENNAYWYYPSQNIYYNEANKSYWYYDKTTTRWASGMELANPYTPLSDKDTRYKITGEQDIWKLNKDHQTKYPIKKNSMPKDKMKPSGN